MRLSILRHLPPVSSSCVSTFLLYTVLFSIVADAASADEIVVREGEHQHGHGHIHAHSDEGVALESNTSMTEGMNMSNDDHNSSAVSPSPLPPQPHAHAGHSHGSHAAPLTTLDDAGIHFWHKFPPTYLAADFRLDNDSAIFGEEFDETWDPENESGHKGLVFLHAVGFYSAYFGLLPLTLALRAAEHPSHYLVNAAFIVLATLGWLSGAAYKSATVDRYEGSVYPTFVTILLLLSFGLAIIDSLDLIKRVYSSWRLGDRSWADLKSHVMQSIRDPQTTQNRYEMVGLEPERQSEDHHVMFALGEDEEEEESPARTLASNPPRRPSLLRQWSPPSRDSMASEGTLHESPLGESPTESLHRKQHNRVGAYDAEEDLSSPVWQEETRKIGISRFLQIALTWLRRFQVVFAYITFIAGMTTYTGMCRAGFISSCAAHYVKGSIFFLYGLLTFARYLGAYADLGWAWNRHVGGRRGVTAEMVECSVIFVYGITNTWLERLGAAPGDPYTVKQVQHISIAVMFWFAGLSGILLESKTVRKILAAVKGRRAKRAPHSYVFSFNPLPALVIAVTGLAMAAHHQTYLFQVQIHTLWGTLLAGGSAFRFLTYFFLWLRPPTDSILPSRPPTEVLTSFGYAAGGIVFMLSNEEIAFAAMRAGYDDMMAFLNFTIALTSLIFCWTVVVMTVKGWAVLRMEGSVLDEESA